LVIVFAFVGDSTMMSDFAMSTPSEHEEFHHPYQISEITATRTREAAGFHVEERAIASRRSGHPASVDETAVIRQWENFRLRTCEDGAYRGTLG
jgi:hypothetical protein